MDKTQILIAVIASIPGILSTIYLVIKSFKDSKKEKLAADNEAQRIEIDATDVAQKSVTVLLEPLNKRITDLEATGEKCKRAIAQFEELVKQKDARNAELEQIIKSKDEKIAEMQKEIDELRARVAQLEEKNGGTNDSRN